MNIDLFLMLSFNLNPHLHFSMISSSIFMPELDWVYLWKGTSQLASRTEVLLMTTHRLPDRKELIWVSLGPCSFECRSWYWQSSRQNAPNQNHLFYKPTHFYLLCAQICSIVWGRDGQFCFCEWPILPSISDWRCWGPIITKKLCLLVYFGCCIDYPYRSTPSLKSTSLHLSKEFTTLKCFVEFDDVGVLQ